MNELFVLNRYRMTIDSYLPKLPDQRSYSKCKALHANLEGIKDFKTETVFIHFMH